MANSLFMRMCVLSSIFSMCRFSGYMFYSFNKKEVTRLYFNYLLFYRFFFVDTVYKSFTF